MVISKILPDAFWENTSYEGEYPPFDQVESQKGY